ncbi:MAG: hypothetical protein U0X93_13870 [Anaerolineales bacterium]
MVSSKASPPGIFIAAALFVISYSRVSVIKNTLSGSVYHSKVDRPKIHRDISASARRGNFHHEFAGHLLRDDSGILDKLRARIADHSQGRLGYIVTDFRRVTHLDYLPVFGITRLKQVAEAEQHPHGVDRGRARPIESRTRRSARRHRRHLHHQAHVG